MVARTRSKIEEGGMLGYIPSLNRVGETNDLLFQSYMGATAPEHRSPEHFEQFKAVRGPSGEWLSPTQIYQKEQAAALKDQEALDEELRPFILESMGLRYNAQGKLEKIPPAALTPEQLEEKKLEDAYKEYLTFAQEGKLPVSLATQKTLTEQEEMLNEKMSRGLGTDWRQSTPGVRQQGDFFLTSEAAKESERHGRLEEASNLLNTRQASISDMTQRRLGLMEGVGSPTYSLVNAYNVGQQPHLFQGLLDNKRNMYEGYVNSANRAGTYGLIGAGVGAVGQGVGAYYGYYNQPSNYNYPDRSVRAPSGETAPPR